MGTSLSDRQKVAVLRPIIAAALAFLGGIATGWAQGAFPEWLTSLANSAGGWTVVGVGLVWWSNRGPLPSAVLGAVFFFLLHAGYAALSAARGLTWSLSPTNFWVGMGFLAGPLVGLGTVWLRDRRDTRSALGTAGLAGLLIGEGLYGLTVISATTSPVYWTLSIATGAVCLLWACMTRLSGRAARTIAILGTAVVVVAQAYAYAAANPYRCRRPDDRADCALPHPTATTLASNPHQDMPHDRDGPRSAGPPTGVRELPSPVSVDRSAPRGSREHREPVTPPSLGQSSGRG